jgi:hypothetical protein
MLLRGELADCRTIAAKGTAQNALCLAKAEAGYYVKVVTAYLTRLKMIVATPCYHSSIIRA